MVYLVVAMKQKATSQTYKNKRFDSNVGAGVSGLISGVEWYSWY